MRVLLLPALALALAAGGCLSPQTRLELAKAQEQVAALEVQVTAAEQSQAVNLAHLRQQLERAQAQLAAVEEKASVEREELTAEAVEQGASALGPVIGTFLPGAAIALGALGIGAGAIRRRAAKKRKAAEATNG